MAAEEKLADWPVRNALHLENEIRWFVALAERRIALHLQTETESESPIDAPELVIDGTPYAEFVVGNALAEEERLMLIAVLLPFIRPQALDVLRLQHQDGSKFAEFGGVKAPNHAGMIPTGETILFLLAGTDLVLRFFYQQLLDPDHPLFRGKWLQMGTVSSIEPIWSAPITPSSELVAWLTTGDLGSPEFGTSFPAEKIETNREWSELVLPGSTLREVQEVLDWIVHEDTVMNKWGLGRKLAPGYRALFYGPPGTGKTFTTTLLGRASGREVYRIDLSMVVSKYIGETEKNLKNVFDKAQSRGWILFFDEADALFGQRTNISDSKDRFANQEVSYLLQRVENFDGVAILATNNKENLDSAFTRRFQSVVLFPVPNADERLRLWESALPPALELGPDVDLRILARKFEMTGGSIMNVIRTCGLNAAKRGNPVLRMGDFMDGIRKEFQKTGQIMA
ncbi:MAG: ATP-binding protein [Bacteroidota bacterium]